MTDLSSKTKRKRLAARAAPHYCRLAKGVSLGWRFRGSHPAKWVVKLTTPDGKYLNRTIGDAEDGGWPGGLTYDAAADEARKIAGAPRLASKITVGDAIDAWRDDRSAGASTSIAKAKIRSEAKLLKEGLGHLRLVDLTAKDLEKWRAGLLRAAEDKRAGKATINRKIAGLKAALNKAATGQQGPHPWDGLEKFKKAESFGARIRVLTRDEEAALLLACPPDLLRFVTFLLRTGARPGEAAAVEIQNILLSEDDNGGWITTTGKVGERTFRLDPAFGAMVREWIGPRKRGPLLLRDDGMDYSNTRYEAQFKAAVERAELENVTAYSCRDSFISRALRKGASIAAVAKHAGTSPDQIMRSYFSELPTETDSWLGE